jgi:hypothetical protein
MSQTNSDGLVRACSSQIAIPGRNCWRPQHPARVDHYGVQMQRWSLRAWIPMFPWSIWPLAGHARLGQNIVVGSMTVLLVLLGSIPRKSMAGPPFSLQANLTTV